MAQENRNNQMEQIELFSYDPVVILRDVFRRWYLILTVALLAGMIAFLTTEKNYQPDYTTTTTFVVSTQDDSGTVYQNLSATTSLASVFSEVLNSSILRQTVLEDIHIPAFDGSIQASAVAETNLITMTVTGHDPRTTFLVTRSIIENHSVVSYQVMGDIILEVLQDPVVPMYPVNPMGAGSSMKKVAVLSAAAMCLLLGVMSFLRDAVRSRKEAEEKTGNRVLCELHHEKKHQRLKAILEKRKTSILVTNPATSFSYVEKVRKLRRKVEQYMPEDGKVLLVTSILENEGKSTVAVNLALSMAQKRQKVLLIEGDLRRPACHKILEQKSEKGGVFDVLSGKIALSQAVTVCTRLKNLNLLLEEKARKNSVDLMSSKEMKRMMQEARRQFDFIIIDTPPMAVGADTECMADLADAFVLVVRQNAATAEMINHGLNVLCAAGPKNLGLVLNNMYSSVLSEDSSYGYGYGQYGHYGHYGHYGAYGARKKSMTGKDKAGNEHEL